VRPRVKAKVVKLVSAHWPDIPVLGLRPAVSAARKSLIAVAHLGRNFSPDAARMMFKSDIFLCA
jgi:hypothetical protein